jgi:hypothetical protein
MQSYRVVNLLIPGDPLQMSFTTRSGGWVLEQAPDFRQAKAAITSAASLRPETRPVAETYFLENPAAPSSGAAASDQAFDELTPILLAATYATGLSVTIERSSPASEVLISTPSHHWPRARAISGSSFVVNSQAEFQSLVEAFVKAWPTTGRTEKSLLLVHHWVDALACWSMEDLYLSATTLLQVIVATEATKQGKAELHFYPGVSEAASRFGLQPLGPDFKNMRNELVHDGKLIGSRFAGPDKLACAQVVADVLNWFDDYLHAALNLGPVTRKRFAREDWISLNAYSI